jgi:hypothetical protein
MLHGSLQVCVVMFSRKDDEEEEKKRKTSERAGQARLYGLLTMDGGRREGGGNLTRGCRKGRGWAKLFGKHPSDPPESALALYHPAGAKDAIAQDSVC